MGADLICYIAFGPETIELDDSRAMKIARQVHQYLDDCIDAAERLIVGGEDVSDPRKKPVKAKRSMTLRLEIEEKPKLPKFTSVEQLRSHPDYRKLIHDVLADCGYGVEAEHVFNGTLEDLVKEVQNFVSCWNDDWPRDWASRDDPRHSRRKVVAAGELSWGDEPDGHGYQTLKKAFGLTIAQLLGVN